MHRKPASPQRVVIEAIEPQVDGGRYPAKRTPGEPVVVEADIFTDGHDQIRALVRWREVDQTGGALGDWHESSMRPIVNDRWTGRFEVEHVGWFEYEITAWVDRFGSWRHEIEKKFGAGQDVGSELLEGAAILRRAAARTRARRKAPLRGHAPTKATTPAADRARLERAADVLAGTEAMADRVAEGLSAAVADAVGRCAERVAAVTSPVLRVIAEPERARYGAWYEMFPRSCGPDPTRSATFDEAAERFPELAALGFDVIYLPPVHPIGRAFRKGPNNTLTSRPGDPGSPWAIGGPEGGHMAVEPGLGTIDDFDRFVEKARTFGFDIALDLAYQCSPDHPYVKAHPEWFRHRPDGTIKYAENPPKKYQDIYPFDFECEAWPALWDELKQIVLFWIEHGVRIFRVDNPHTKPFRFWEWMLAEVRRQHPGVIFLSEAFTRPKVMRHLAKLGFSQSYTYFTWRNTKAEIEEYFTELTQTAVREYMRPNLFANTPDILHAYLQRGGRPAFEVRLVLAATLGATYGIYSGFELCENRAVPGTEEYQDSEKYQFKRWDWDRPGHIKALVARVNQIRRTNPALQGDSSLRFHQTDNPQLVCYSKETPDQANVLLMAVNLDPHTMQQGWIQVPVSRWGLDPRGYRVDDLLSGESYHWRGEWNYVRMDPGVRPAHILRIRRDAVPQPPVV